MGTKLRKSQTRLLRESRVIARLPLGLAHPAQKMESNEYAARSKARIQVTGVTSRLPRDSYHNFVEQVAPSPRRLD